MARLDDVELLTPEAREFGAAPKGLMTLGVPGCARAHGEGHRVQGLSKVRFDLSKVFVAGRSNREPDATGA